MTTNEVPRCEFCGDPAAENKGQPGKYRKYCSDMCMRLTGALKRLLTERTDKVRIRQLAGAISEMQQEAVRIVQAGQPCEPKYSNGYQIDVATYVRRSLMDVGAG